ncbi:MULTISPECIES: sigma-54-dependent Fis family transcriptional regulator [Luteimonas]|uniref:sigma-54-dependent Fis family transcriptional regulator n=1 Tax=Luteimonas TaxID=83614 RepID=UPI000465EF85|nr:MULTISPECIES: sigma-54-dependent Fis family transcriptional regulator [Luteimonas]
MAATRNPDIARARRAFFEWGGVPADAVPVTILRSWRRCRQLGVGRERADIAPVEQARLREMRERHGDLVRHARAELAPLAADCAAAGGIVVLTDAEGWILDAQGHAGFLDKAGQVALLPGACWNEARVGTNAIGTAIHEARAVIVRGGEHYIDPHRILTCSAVPVFDPYGRLAGVLDITGDASVPQVHALALARRAVASIEHRYFDDGIPDSEVLHLHHDPALIGTAHEGLLAFRNGRLVAANGAGLALFGLERSDLERAGWDALFEAPLSRLRDDGLLLDREGRALYGHVRAPSPAPHAPSPARRSPARTSAGAGPAADPGGPILEPAVRALLDQAGRVLDAGIPVLVQGETGTGKEVFARALHRAGARAGRPFVAVNCAALPEGLIESELFGYEEGAFTGARRRGSPGLLRQAEGGVLFLDEIGDMPLALQPRLLRVLQDRELTPLGGGRPVKLDFALVCASHRDLAAAVEAGDFRADLYYRLSHHVVRLPALREHADPASLVRALWARMAQGRTLAPAALAALAAHPWPGNLRQLDGCLRTLVALTAPGQAIGPELLPAPLRDGAAPAPVPAMPAAAMAAQPLDALTLAAMQAAVAACDGNIARAARRLGISRSTLYRRLGSDPRRAH